MAIGFVLISAAPAKENDVYQNLMAIHEVTELHPLFGEYDVIARVEARDYVALGDVVTRRIRKLPGIVDTKTLTGTRF